MDPRRLLTFRAVAHERSFSAAAKALSRSQPSVSTQIGLLEAEVGARLFQRGPREVRLTTLGAALLEHADHVAWRLELADAQIAAIVAERHEQVRLAGFPTSLAELVPAAMARLRAEHPDVRVVVDEVVPSELTPRLLRGEFDLALSYQDASLPRREIATTRREDLLQETFLVGLPRDHRLADTSEPIDLSELADEDWILPSTSGFLIEACREAGFEPRIAALSHEPLGTRGMIARGLGVGWVAGLVGSGGDIATRPVLGTSRRRDVYALLPPGRRHPHADAVLAALRATAASLTTA